MSQAQQNPPESGTESGTEADEDGIDDGIKEILYDVPSWSDTAKDLFTLLALSDEPLSRGEVTEKVGMSESYLYKPNPLSDHGLLKKVKYAENGVGRVDWTISEVGVQLRDALQQKKDEHPEAESVLEVIEQEAETWEHEAEKLEREREGAESGDPFACKFCAESFKKYSNARRHVTNSESGKHRGRSGQEPGTVVVYEDRLDKDDNIDRYNGVERVTGDVRVIPSKNGQPEQTSQEGVKVAGSIDGRTDDAVGGPTTIKNRRVNPSFLKVGINRNEAFELLSSDAPESVRERVFNQIVSMGEGDGEGE